MSLPQLGLEPAQNVTHWHFAGPVAQAYELARGPVEVIVGPTGGGKSTASARRCLRVATWQHPSPRDGVRKARTVVVTPTYRGAWDQVIPSYLKVMERFGGSFSGAKGDPFNHIFDAEVPIRGVLSRIHVEVLFRAVGAEMDLERFYRGLEATAFWYPEMDTHPDENIISKGSNRVGRYPEPDDRPDDPNLPIAYAGVWGDANAPIIDSWFHTRFYGAKRPGERLHLQPSGFSARAENMMNLRKIRPDYYAHQATQLDPHDVGRLLHNKPGYGRHGQPVHPDFDPDVHVIQRSLEVDPRQPVIIGVDCGSNALVPAAAFLQRSYLGQWRALAEIHIPEPTKAERALGATGQMRIEELGTEIRRLVATRFRTAKGAVLILDPAAGSGNATSPYSTAQLLQHHTKIEAQLAPSNDIKPRRDALARVLKAHVSAKEPSFVISGPDCPGLTQSLTGGWHYAVRGGKRAPAPEKNRYSHIGEACEYAILGGDGVDAVAGGFIRHDGEAADTGPQVIIE